MAACVWAGEGSAAWGRAAARLWGLDTFDRAGVEICTPRNVRPPRGVNFSVHYRVRLCKHELRTLRSIPTTAPERTLLDLGAVVSPMRVELGLEDALRKGLTTLPRVRDYARDNCGRGRRGCKTLKRLLDGRPAQLAPTESYHETRCWQFFKKYHLPLPVRQLRVPGGDMTARFDFAYPDALLAIESESYRFHGGRKAWRHDRRRVSALAALGWRIVYITKEDLDERPKEKADQIRRALGVHSFLQQKQIFRPTQ